MGVVYIIARLVMALLSVLEIAMFIRAILSWFPAADGTAFSDLVYTVTEPVIAPIRVLIDRMGWFRSLPIDVSFLIAYLLLFLLQGLFGGLTAIFF